MRKKTKIKIFATLIVAILLIPSVYAATLCSYRGPDTSEHDLQLSDFLVSGDSPVRVGDKVSVSFKLTNVGRYSVTFDDENGVFVAAKDPDGKMRMFGNTYRGKTLEPKGSVTFKTDLTLDKEGAWTLWASYCIKVERTTKCGPEEWHSCRIKVEAKPTPTPTPTVTPSPTPVCPKGCECLTEETAKELGYVYCNGEKILCGYDQYRKPMYCYEKPAIRPTPTPTPSPTLFLPPLIPVCPSGCECLTGPDAELKFGGSMVSCSDQVCGYGWVGDLYLPKYCFREISIEECKDTDGGKNYGVKGSAAGYEDVCSPFSDEILQEYYVVEENGKCVVKSELHDCNALCEDGRCLPPTCDDWIQNQAEQGIDCGGPCTTACVCPSGCKCSTWSDAEKKAEKVFGGIVKPCSDNVCGYGLQGDVSIPKFCYKILIEECKDTDGGLNYDVKGSALGYEDVCSPFSNEVLQEYYVVEVNGKCEVKSQFHDCHALCEDGRCLPPTCDDLIQNQGEEGVDCGGPCPPCVECTWCGDYVTPIRIRGEYDKGFIDIVFIPDLTYQGGDLDFDRFVNDAKGHIRNGYFQMDTMAVDPIPNNYKDRFNFYYYTGGFGNCCPGGCAGELPSNFWSKDHADFADVGGILRDVQGAAGCATGGPPGHFQARANTDVVVHETGHVIFGLADEYCGCRAGYWQGSPANLWSSLSGCQDDATSEGWTLGNCRRVCSSNQAEQGPALSTCPDKELGFWRYDPDPDMMGNGGGTIGEACTRRINYVFNNWPTSSSKGILIWLNIKDDEITELSSEITDAHPDIGLQYGHFRVDLLSGDDRLIKSFDLWDPRIEFGEEAVYLDDVNFPVRFPWYKNLRKVNMYDKSSGELMITVDLTDTIIDFCSQHKDDPECVQALKNLQPQSSFLPIALVVVVILATITILTLLLRRRKKEE